MKTGKWLPRNPGYESCNAMHYCSECKAEVSGIKTLYYKFCPECGASMKGSVNHEQPHTAKHGNRPCIVKGNKGWFHGWFYKENLIIKFPYVIKSEERRERINQLLEDYKKRGYLSGELDGQPVVNVMALVEYEDGTIHEVCPTDIKFVD